MEREFISASENSNLASIFTSGAKTLLVSKQNKGTSNLFNKDENIAYRSGSRKQRSKVVDASKADKTVHRTDSIKNVAAGDSQNSDDSFDRASESTVKMSETFKLATQNYAPGTDQKYPRLSVHVDSLD